MVVTTQRFTIDNYMAYDEGTDTAYERVNGELVPVTLDKGQHSEIAAFLNNFP